MDGFTDTSEQYYAGYSNMPVRDDRGGGKPARPAAPRQTRAGPSPAPSGPSGPPGPRKEPAVEVPFPSAAKAPVTKGLVQRPVNYVLDRLPVAVGSRVKPLYANYAEGAVARVDGALLAAADRGSAIVGGAKKRLFKVPSTDYVPGLARPGMATRALMAVESAFDKLLPPPKKVDGIPVTPTLASAALEDISLFRRTADLLEKMYIRLYIHAEVRIILLKVRTKVFYDVSIKPPIQRAASAVAERKAFVMHKVAAIKAAVVKRSAAVNAFVKRQVNAVAGKLSSAKFIVDARAQAVGAKCRSLKENVVAKGAETSDIVRAKTAPYVNTLTEKLRPVTVSVAERIAYVKELKERLVKAILQKKAALVSAALTKRATLLSKAQAKIAPAKGYTLAKYQKVRSTTTTYAAKTSAAVKRVMDKVLGVDRATKVKGLTTKYMATLSRAVAAHA